MRPLVFYAASSLDGHLITPRNAVEWLAAPSDPLAGPLLDGADGVLLGTAAFDFLLGHGVPSLPGIGTYVFSHTRRQEDHPDVTVVGTDPTPFVQDLKASAGGPLWLMGGGVIFRYLLAAGLVDHVVVALRPVLQGNGIPLLPYTEEPVDLTLVDTARHGAGLVSLHYRCAGAGARRSSP